MNRETIFKNRRTDYHKCSLIISLIVACMILMPLSLISQVKSGSSEKAPTEHGSTNSIIIHQEIDFKGTPKQLYQTLLSSKEFSACIKMSFPNFTEMSATIDSAVGGTFSLF